MDQYMDCLLNEKYAFKWVHICISEFISDHTYKHKLAFLFELKTFSNNLLQILQHAGK